MTSMAVSNTGNVRSHFLSSRFNAIETKHGGFMPKMGYFGPRKNMITSKEKRLLVKANAGSSRKVQKINGKKVNGLLQVDEPYMGNALLEKESKAEFPLDSRLLGRFVEDRFVYRQNFIIRSYEIGPDKTATMETLMNLLQVSSYI